jgi:flagellar biosynthesis/type III secretory pathway chaperone
MTELTATETPSSPWAALLLAVPNEAARLAEILGLEFEALKIRDLAAFEALQEEKNLLLQNLAQLAEWAAAQTPVPLPWQQVQDSLRQSKQDHLRNIQLLQRQLQAVKGALQALQGESAAPAVDLYDRMGQIARRPGAWGYQLA